MINYVNTLYLGILAIFSDYSYFREFNFMVYGMNNNMPTNN